MRRSIFLLGTLLAAWPLQAAQVLISSPDVAETLAFSQVLEKHLRRIPATAALAVSVTFSNLDYMSRTEPRRDERFDFILPEVRFDAEKHLYYLPLRDRERLPVAEVKKRFIGQTIEPLPGIQIRVSQRGGRATAALSTGP